MRRRTIIASAIAALLAIPARRDDTEFVQRFIDTGDELPAGRYVIRGVLRLSKPLSMARGAEITTLGLLVSDRGGMSIFRGRAQG